MRYKHVVFKYWCAYRQKQLGVRDDFVSISQLATRVCVWVCFLFLQLAACIKQIFFFQLIKLAVFKRLLHVTSQTFFYFLTLCSVKTTDDVIFADMTEGWDGGMWVGQWAGQLVLVAFWFRLWDSNSNVTGLIPDTRTCELEHY